MSDEQKAYQATPSASLEQQITSACVPKNEREWWAHREILALRATITQQAQELEWVKRKNTNHFETLRGIAAMPVTDGERMQQWAKDGLSGYTGPLESTLLKLTDELAASQARCREMEEKYVHQDLLLDEQDKVAHLQATLAAREATINGYRHSFEIMGRNHDDRRAERDAAMQEVKRLQLTWTTARPTVAGNYWVRALMMHAGGFERGSFIVLFDGKVAFIAIGTRNEVIPIEVSSMKDSEWAGPIPLPTEAQQAGGSSGGEANHEGVGA